MFASRYSYHGRVLALADQGIGGLEDLLAGHAGSGHGKVLSRDKVKVTLLL